MVWPPPFVLVFQESALVLAEAELAHIEFIAASSSFETLPLSLTGLSSTVTPNHR